MAIPIRFGGKVRTERGVYFERRSGEPTPLPVATFGNVLLLDTGSSEGYGVGSGINGEIYSGKDAIYEFLELENFRQNIRGGKHYKIGTALFNPSQFGDGATRVWYASAKSTKAARMFHAFSGGIGTGARATSNLRVVSATIVNAGTGYQIGDTITLAGGTFSTAAVITVSTIGGGGEILTFTISTPGVYTAAPADGNATQSSTSGTGVDAEFSITFGLNAITVSAGGSGYTVAPTVIIRGGNGSGATATATLALNAVSTVTVSAPGDNYIVPPVISFAATNGNGGFVEIMCKVEGLAGNGAVSAGKITRGFGWRMIAGTDDPSKFVIQYYWGTFTGLDQNGLPYDGTLEVDTIPEVIAETPEFSNFSELDSYYRDDFNFNQFFKVANISIYGTGAITSADLSGNAGNNLAAGGLETYSATDLDDLLEAIQDADIDFILSDKYGAFQGGAQSVTNFKLQNFVQSRALQLMQLYIACGKDKNELRSTYGAIETAKTFNSEKVTVVHGGAFISNFSGVGSKQEDEYYLAALVCGRESGIAPQLPITTLDVNVKGLTHTLTDKDRRDALRFGVLCIVPDGEFFIVHQGINTLQGKLNETMINPDGTSYEKSMFRIDGAMQKELRLQAKAKKFAGGGNRNTASVNLVREFALAYLQSRVSTVNEDNLIIAFSDVKVTSAQDANFLEYRVVKNSPINKLLITSYSALTI